MKKLLFVCGISFLFISTLCADIYKWNEVTNFQNSWACYCFSLVVSSSDVLYCTFPDDEKLGTETGILKRENGIWTQINFSQEEEFPAGSENTLLLDETNKLLYFVSSDYSTYVCVIKKYNLTNEEEQWDDVDTTGLPLCFNWYYAVTLLPSKDLCVLYTNGDGSLGVKKYTNGKWVSLDKEGFAYADKYKHPNIVSSSDSLYIGFERSDDGISVMKYNKQTDKWEYVGGEKVVSGQIYYFSMAVSDNNVLYVAFTDPDYNNKISVKKYNGFTDKWEYVGEPGEASSIDEPVLCVNMVTSKDGKKIYVAYGGGQCMFSSIYDSDGWHYVHVGQDEQCWIPRGITSLYRPSKGPVYLGTIEGYIGSYPGWIHILNLTEGQSEKDSNK